MTVHHDTDGLQHVSLFTGIGGIDLALHRAGVPTIAACESDPAARAVYSHHFPHVPVHHDVTKVTADDIRRAGAVPERTVLSAGFPCQDLSVAGRRAGLHGARSGLFWHIVRLAAATHPRWIILENVTGLLSAVCPCPGEGACGHPDCTDLHPVGPDGACPGGCFPAHGGVMGTILGALANLGYGFAYRVLDAQFFGVPQRRRRVVIVASLGDTGAASAQILLEPNSGGRDSTQGGAEGTAVAGGAGAGAAGSGGGLLADTGVVRALTERQGLAGIDLTDAEAGHVIAFDRAQITHPENRSNPQPGDPAPSLASTGYAMVARRVSLHGREGGNQIEVGKVGEPADPLRAADGGSSRGMIVTHALTAEGHDASEDGTGRSTPLIPYAIEPETGQGADLRARETQISPALTPTSEGAKTDRGLRLADAQSVRRLTPLECERLQGLPDGWTRLGRGDRDQPDATRYRQLGNTVAVPVFEWVARRLVTADQDERTEQQ